MKVKCVGCEKKFNVIPEIFANYEIIFCPVCGLDYQVIKKTSHVTSQITPIRPNLKLMNQAFDFCCLSKFPVMVAWKWSSSQVPQTEEFLSN